MKTDHQTKSFMSVETKYELSMLSPIQISAKTSAILTKASLWFVPVPPANSVTDIEAPRFESYSIFLLLPLA